MINYSGGFIFNNNVFSAKDSVNLMIDATTNAIRFKLDLTESKHFELETDHKMIYFEDYQTHQEKINRRKQRLLSKLLDPPENPVKRVKRLLKKTELSDMVKNNKGFSR